MRALNASPRSRACASEVRSSSPASPCPARPAHACSASCSERRERRDRDRPHQAARGVRVVGQGALPQREAGVGEGGRADLVEVRVLAVHPEERHAGDTRALGDDGRQAHRGRGLVERVEGAAEWRGLLARHRARGLAAREPRERFERARRGAQAAVVLRQLRGQWGGERGGLGPGERLQRGRVAPARGEALAGQRPVHHQVLRDGVEEPVVGRLGPWRDARANGHGGAGRLGRATAVTRGREGHGRAHPRPGLPRRSTGGPRAGSP